MKEKELQKIGGLVLTRAIKKMRAGKVYLKSGYDGQKGEIKVSYATNRVGGFSKSITIYSNAKNPKKVIRIKGLVNKPISLEKTKSILTDS